MPVFCTDRQTEGKPVVPSGLLED